MIGPTEALFIGCFVGATIGYVAGFFVGRVVGRNAWFAPIRGANAVGSLKGNDFRKPTASGETREGLPSPEIWGRDSCSNNESP